MSMPYMLTLPVYYGFGDSIMYGTAASPLSNCWFHVMCNSKGVAPNNYGIGGTTTADFLSSGFIIPKLGPNQRIILAWGVNDCQSLTSGQYTTNLTSIINSIKNSGTLAFQIYTVTAYYVDPTWAHYAAYQTFITAAKSVKTSTGINELDFSGLAYALEADKVHPTNSAHLNSIGPYAISNVN